jgi:hypothetical protein
MEMVRRQRNRIRPPPERDQQRDIVRCKTFYIANAAQGNEELRLRGWVIFVRRVVWVSLAVTSNPMVETQPRSILACWCVGM